MKAEQFTVQSYKGGPEFRFYNRMPCVLRADIALSSDPEFESLSLMAQSSIRAVAMCILAARMTGLARKLKTPRNITVESCLEFAERYQITVDNDAEIPSEAEVEDENPTDTPGEAS